MDSRDKFWQVVSSTLHVHLLGHEVTVALCKRNKTIMIRRLGVFLAIVPIKYDKQFKKLTLETVGLTTPGSSGG
jgi:hypothetical protein